MSVKCQVGSDCGCGFKNTGMNYSEIWSDIENTIKTKVECDECRIHGLENLSGLRDHIKAGIGGHVFDSKNYRNFVKEVNCVFEKCSIEGRC